MMCGEYVVLLVLVMDLVMLVKHGIGMHKTMRPVEDKLVQDDGDDDVRE